MEYIDEAWDYYKQFVSVFTQSAQNTKHTQNFTRQLQDLLNTFSLKLQQLIDKYSDGFFETDQGRLLGGSLSKIAASYKSLSVQLKNEVLEPFLMFMENFKTTIEAVAKKAADSLTELQKQRIVLAKSQSTYYQNSLKMIKSKQDIQKAIEKIEKGGKNTDLVKANEISMKLRIIATENEREYKQCVDKTNVHWKKALKELSSLRGMVDYNEQSRLSFTKNTTNAMLRLIMQEWPIPDRQQIEQTLNRRDSHKPKVHQVEAKLDRFITNDKKQHFISYQDSNRKQIKKSQSSASQSDVTTTDVENIQQLLQVWLAGSEVKPSESLDNIRVLIMSQRSHSCYFVESIYRRVQAMPGYYCKLEDEHFNEIHNVFLLIARCIGSQDPETMWKLINVSMRLMRRKKDKNNTGLRELICSHLGKERAFQDEKLWQSIWQYIRERNIKKPVQQASGWGSILAQGWRGLNNLVGNSKPMQEEDQLKTVQEVAILMSSLCLPSQFCFPIVKKMMDSIGEGRSLELLKDHLYSKQDIQLRQKLTNFKEKALSKQQKYISLIASRRAAPYVLKQIAKRGYLNVNDINLRLVCRQLKNVHRIILYQLDHVNHKYQRLIDAPSRDYIAMKHEVAENSCPSSIEQIISLDVNRSLHIHADYLSPTLLHTLLRIFAYYNKQIGYCQGMNYLAGYLFIKTRNEQQAYLVFEKMMRDRFWQVFVNEFESLKLKMYQFDRLLNIFIPELADHFKRQMVSPECYIVSWVIALFSSTYQYAKESYLVDLLWLRFMVWGWREFFKFVLWLLAKFKDELIELSFDRILHMLGDTLRGELMTSSRENLQQRLSPREFGQQLDRFRVTSGLLQKLEKQYKMSTEG